MLDGIFQDGTYFDYDDMEARIMQHLAAARYFRRREMQRYPALDASQVVDSSSAATASLMLPTNANSPNFCHGSSDTDIPTSVIRSTDNAQPPSSDPGTNRDGPFKSRYLFRTQKSNYFPYFSCFQLAFGWQSQRGY